MPLGIVPALLYGLFYWLLLATATGVLAGAASAAFLVSLDWATAFRESHLWVIALLPLGGFAVGWTYHRFGREVEGGTSLILDEIHDPKSVVPLRMTPLVLLGTVATHFFGGSAGREGTAVQMGASLADQLSVPMRIGPERRRILLMAGISAGFSSVFGTPLAGAIFGLEVLAIGRLRYDAIFPCFIAAIVGHATTLALGAHHTAYSVGDVPAMHLSLWGTATSILAAIVAGVIFGLTSQLFSGLTHRLGALFKSHITYPPLRPALGALPIVAAVFLLGTTRYIGLGLPVISESFEHAVPAWDFAAKILFTAWTLGAGFKGGEVTPLFFIGATLGNALAWFLPLPMPLLAGMGFVAVFAGAANTPLASTIMAIELFGGQAGLYAALACVVSYLFSGHEGIYRSQRVAVPKHGDPPKA